MAASDRGVLYCLRLSASCPVGPPMPWWHCGCRWTRDSSQPPVCCWCRPVSWTNFPELSPICCISSTGHRAVFRLLQGTPRPDDRAFAFCLQAKGLELKMPFAAHFPGRVGEHNAVALPLSSEMLPRRSLSSSTVQAVALWCWTSTARQALRDPWKRCFYQISPVSIFVFRYAAQRYRSSGAWARAGLMYDTSEPCAQEDRVHSLNIFCLSLPDPLIIIMMCWLIDEVPRLMFLLNKALMRLH